MVTEGDGKEGIKNLSLKAFKWSALTEILSIAIQPIVTLVLARLLSPSEFGIVAVATVAIGVAQLVQEFGMGKALIQTEEYAGSYANNAFWVNCSLGIIIYGIIFLSAPVIGQFFHSPESVAVLRILCFQIIFTGFCSVHSALLQRQMKFREIFLVRFTTSLVPGIISIVMAYKGMGVWALVWGSLLSSFGQLVLFWFFSDWRPRLIFDLTSMQIMFSYSKWIMLEAVLAWCISNGDSIALGHYLGVKDMGVYRISSSLIIFVSFCSMAPIVPVAFSLFSRLQNDSAELCSTFTQLTRYVAALSLPLGFGVALLAKPITVLVLGDKWVGAEIVIALLAIRFGVDWVFGLGSTLYASMGRPKLNFILLLAGTVISLPAYVVAAPYGLKAFCAVRLITTMVLDVVSYYVLIRVLELPTGYFSQPLRLPCIGVLFMSLVLIALMNFVVISSWYLLVFAVIFGALSYVFCLWIFDRDFISSGSRYVLQIIR